MKKLILVFLFIFPLSLFALPSDQKIHQHAIVTVDQLQAVWLKAKAGDASAQARLGSALMDGSIGLLPNYPKAFYWFQKAAKKGDPVAYFHLATLYWLGEVVPRDYEKSLYYLRLAYKGLNEKLNKKNYVPQDLPLLQYSLGCIYFSGVKGIAKQNLPKAFELFHAAAEEGFAHAMHKVAFMYRYGMGTSCNLSKAFKWNLLLAKLGDPYEQYDVGLAYLNGAGVSKNVDQGIAWLNESAKNAYFPAMKELIRLRNEKVIPSISALKARAWYQILNHVFSRHAFINLTSDEQQEMK